MANGLDGLRVADIATADALTIIRGAVDGLSRYAVGAAGDADDIAAEAYTQWLAAGKPYGMSVRSAILAAVAALRESREGLADSITAEAVYASQPTADGLTIADDMKRLPVEDAAYTVRTDGARGFADGARFAIVYAADGYDTDGATYTDADGLTVYGMEALLAARSAALREDTEAAHGSAAANRGAANQAASADRDAAVAAAYRATIAAHGRKGYAERVAVALGWLTADATEAQRLAALNRVRVAVSRMMRRTDGDDSHSARD